MTKLRSKNLGTDVRNEIEVLDIVGQYRRVKSRGDRRNKSIWKMQHSALPGIQVTIGSGARGRVARYLPVFELGEPKLPMRNIASRDSGYEFRDIHGTDPKYCACVE